MPIDTGERPFEAMRMIVIRRCVLVSLAAVFATKAVLAQESVAAKEKTAANKVATFIEQVRQQNSLPKLRRIGDKHLRADACGRAMRGEKLRDRSATPFGPEKVGTLSTFWYSTLDPNQPPPELLEWAKGPDAKYEQPHRFAVAVCLFTTSDGAEQRYWVDVGTYMSAIKSILVAPMWD